MYYTKETAKAIVDGVAIGIFLASIYAGYAVFYDWLFT